MKRKLFVLVFTLFFVLLGLATSAQAANNKVFTCHNQVQNNDFTVTTIYSPDPIRKDTTNINFILSYANRDAQIEGDEGYFKLEGEIINPTGKNISFSETAKAGYPDKSLLKYDLDFYPALDQEGNDVVNYSISFSLYQTDPDGLFPGDLFCGGSLDFTIGGDGGGPGPGPGEEDCKIELNYPTKSRFIPPLTFEGVKLDYFTPNDGISFRVDGLKEDANNDIIRGVVIINNSDHSREVTSNCVRNPVLRGGPDAPDKTSWVHISTGIGDTLRTGNYTININNSCSIFNTPQAPVICSKNFQVCEPDSDLGCAQINSSCDPSNPKCPNEAPYCLRKDVKNPKSPFVCSKLPSLEEQCKDGSCNTAIGNFGYEPARFAKSVLGLILSLAGGIVLLFLIINGYKLMVSSGDPEKVKEARESIISAVTGLLFIIFALVMLQFLTVDILQLPGFNP